MSHSKIKMGSQIIVELLKRSHEIRDRLRVSLVTNIKGRTSNFNDFKTYSVTTEFFAENEIEDLIGALRQFGFYTDIYFDENKFILAVLDGSFFAVEKDYQVIYNSAQKGTGPGRKSLIPAFCNLHNLSVTGSDPYVVSLCRHKYHYNCILAKLGFPVARSWFFDHSFGWLLGEEPPANIKILAKPTYESASIGLNSASLLKVTESSIATLARLSLELKQPITVQEFIEGYEVEVPVFNPNVPFSIIPVGISVEGEKYLGDKFLTYDTVYNDQYSFYNFENIGRNAIHDILLCTENVARSLNIRGFGRVDYRINRSGEFFITDVSTNPHITLHSSFSFLFETIGLPYENLPPSLISFVCQRNGWI